jgi:hypothetical protein
VSVSSADVIDELAGVVFSLETARLSARGITARVTSAVASWALTKGWSARTEARIEIRAPDGRLRDHGYIDLIVYRGPDAPDLAIEIDQTDKPWSVAKLQYAMALGMEAIWIRWSGAEWTEVEGVHVIHLPEVEKTAARRRVPAQLSFW